MSQGIAFFLNMSVRIMSEVFERSKTQGNARLVLLSLADTCSDEGVCFPSIKTIAKKANISEETTRKFLHAFEKIGLVEAEERFSPVGRRTSNTYKLNLNKVGDDELTKDVIYLAIPKSKHRTSDGMNQFTPSPSNPVHTTSPLNQFIPSPSNPVHTTSPLNQFIPSIMNHHKEPKIEPSSDSATAPSNSNESTDLFPTENKPPQKRKPKLVTDKFITELQALNPDKEVEAEAQKARTWILANPPRQFTQKFLAGWINRSNATIKPERFANF
jgi:DNA-binding transcriptional regulator YhcF (GntR family)